MGFVAPSLRRANVCESGGAARRRRQNAARPPRDPRGGPMGPVVILSVIAVVVGSTSVASHAQSWRPPAENQRCPSKWGAGDERGSGNHMKPETVLRATRLIRTGEGID